MTGETTKEKIDFYKRLAASGPGLVAIMKLSDLSIVFVNNAFEHYLGYTQDAIETEGLQFTQLLDKYQLTRFEYQIKRVDDNFGYRSQYVIYRLKDKKGTIAPYYLYLSFVEGDEDPDGKLVYLLLMPDMSKFGMPFSTFDTKELFLEQFEGEDFGTFEWIIDVDKVYWSQGLYAIYEVDPLQQEITSGFARSFIHPEDSGEMIGDIDIAAEKRGDLDLEFRIVTAKGNTKILHSLGRILKDAEGKPVKFVGSVRDVTRQRAIENDLKNKVEELNHSNKELEEFAYVASHDMQEPLRKITTFGSRLMERYQDVLTGDGSIYLSRMTTAAENMRQLITDLLDFSRIAKTDQPFERVDLGIVLREVKTSLELGIEETGTVINSSPLPVIDGISSQMSQLFSNIISNAIKFHKENDPPVITIHSELVKPGELIHYKLAEDREYYKVEVADNGIGFEEEYAARIFNVFQRLHGKADYPGSGIGLAICKKILEYHSGIIFAESTPGKGARFIFIIPRSQAKSEKQ